MKRTRPRCGWLWRGRFWLLSLLGAGVTYGAPYIPQNDAVVLERAPAAEATSRLEPLRQKLAADPADLQAALQLAEGYLTIGRETADPRFTSYAQATLGPWLRESQPPAAVLVLSATALQSSHQFSQSLQLLDRALALDPRNGQAWLTKATVLQVQGKFAEARSTCGNLLRTAGQVIALSCITGVNSLNGTLDQSYRTLKSLETPSNALSDELRGWIAGQLGEMAARMGDERAAEDNFLSALSALPGDVYIKAAYADLLLDQRRDSQVIDLLDENEQQDVLLLRLAIAGQRLGNRSGRVWAERFEARYQAARRADDNSHLREYARFLLDVCGEAKQALDIARRNWQVQREPADVDIYIRAALAAKLPEAAAEVAAWIRETGYEDRTLPPVTREQAAL